MKTFRWVLVLVLVVQSGFAQSDNPSSDRANRLYPSAAEAGSPLAKAAMKEIDRIKSVEPQRFEDPQCYEKIIKGEAAKLGIAPAKVPALEAIVMDQRVAAWLNRLKQDNAKNAAVRRFQERKVVRQEDAARQAQGVAELMLLQQERRIEQLEQEQRRLENDAIRDRINPRR